MHLAPLIRFVNHILSAFIIAVNTWAFCVLKNEKSLIPHLVLTLATLLH